MKPWKPTAMSSRSTTCSSRGYLQSNVVTSIPLARLEKGNRSSIIFYSAACIYYLSDSFAKLEADASSLLDGSATIFPGAEVTLNDIHQELFTSSNIDCATPVLLQLFSSAFTTYSNMLLADYLPGGEFHSMTKQMQATTASVRPTK